MCCRASVASGPRTSLTRSHPRMAIAPALEVPGSGPPTVTPIEETPVTIVPGAVSPPRRTTVETPVSGAAVGAVVGGGVAVGVAGAGCGAGVKPAGGADAGWARADAASVVTRSTNPAAGQ